MRAATTTNILILAAGLLAGSVVGVAAQEEAAESAGCAGALVEPGVYEGINDFDDAAQSYRVVVPEGYADLAPAPLILWVAAGNGYLDTNFRWWQPYLGEAESIFVVAERSRSNHADPGTMTALLDQLSQDYCIDTRRVHAMGISSSASIVNQLACATPERIASFMTGMGSFLRCASERPVPFVAYTGDPERLFVSSSVEQSAQAYDCASDPVVEDLGSSVTRMTYEGCEADIVLYDIEGAGHGFIRHECLDPEDDLCFVNDEFDMLREAELFFAEHPLPAE